MRRFALLLMFLLTVIPAKAQNSNLTANWLYTVCAAGDEQGQAIYRWWISGFEGEMFSSQELARANKLKPTSCIPNNLASDQAKLIIEKFMRDNQQYMQLSPEMVAAYALVIAFPCP